MDSEYSILFTVSFRHRYFSDLRLNSLNVVPDDVSETFMLNNRMIFKSFGTGFHVLYETRYGTTQRTREELTRGDLLRFRIDLKDKDFYNYTSVFSRDITSTLFYFHNIPEKRKASFSATSLHDTEFVSETACIPFRDLEASFPSKPFGLIEIQLNKELETNYSISFLEKETYWRYILVADHLRDMDNPAVINEDNTFEGPEKVILPNNREALVFVSRDPIPLYQVPKKTFQLVENYDRDTFKYKVVLRSLPAPDIRTISFIPNLKGKQNTNYSEIFIY